VRREGGRERDRWFPRLGLEREVRSALQELRDDGGVATVASIVKGRVSTLR
jgi:hypothetical protein